MDEFWLVLTTCRFNVSLVSCMKRTCTNEFIITKMHLSAFWSHLFDELTDSVLWAVFTSVNYTQKHRLYHQGLHSFLKKSKRKKEVQIWMDPSPFSKNQKKKSYAPYFCFSLSCESTTFSSYSCVLASSTYTLWPWHCQWLERAKHLFVWTWILINIKFLQAKRPKEYPENLIRFVFSTLLESIETNSSP